MKMIFGLCIMMLICLRASAQVQELKQLQLDLEKLAQFKLILTQMKQGYQVLQNGYNSVRDAAKGNFDLHKNYLDGLLVVSPSVKHSPALQEIATEHAASKQMYMTAFRQYLSSGLFTSSELNSLHDKYITCSQKVGDDLELLVQVTSSGKFRMNDAERLEIISTVHEDVTKQHEIMKTMLNDYSRLMVLRQQQNRDNFAVKKLSGLK